MLHGPRERLGVRHRVVPMSEEPVRTIVHTDRGVLAFQDYFVRLRCEPVVNRIEYEGADRAQMSARFEAALNDDHLQCVVICPSNPFLSIAPMLATGGAREKLRSRGVPIIAVSPIVGGHAIKGPAAKIFKELGREASVTEVARFYRGLVDSLVVDEADRTMSSAIAELGIEPVVTHTIMRNQEDRERVAREVIELNRSRPPSQSFA